MGRLLKFRVWDNLKKHWVSNTDVWRIRTKNFGVGELTPPAIYFPQYPEGLTIQQYIGLIDKNGDEIYEGDIVKFVYEAYEHDYEECIGEVFFEDGIFYFSREHQFATNDHNFKKYTLEILGNIIENPEKLKP